MRFSLGLLSFVALAVSAQDTSLQVVKDAFLRANIPKDLSINFNPTALLQVTFPEAVSGPITVHAGEQLLSSSVAGLPVFSVAGVSSPGPFVIAAVDPDVVNPQQPNSVLLHHFLGGDFSLATRNGGLLSSVTPAISPFKQLTLPVGSDIHRYIFLLFEQPAGFDQQKVVTSTTPDSLFSISEFAKEVGLGDPIAGTFVVVASEA